MRLYFVRHGESESNTLGVFCNRPPGHPLTEQGLLQARQLAERLREERITAIYTSPLQRAVQTAATLAEAYGLTYDVTDALREYDMGMWEGSSDPAAWEQNRTLFMQWTIFKQWNQRIPGGESFADVRRRLEPFINSLVAEQRDTDARVALVGHGGIYLAALPMLLNVRFRWALGHPLGNCDVVVAEPDERGLRCITWCGIEPPA